LEIVLRDRLADRAAAMGTRLKQGLFDLQRKYSCIGDVRGRGLLLGLEFEAGGNHASAQTLSDAVTNAALRLGLSANIVRAGASQGVMRIAPPLTVHEEEIDLGLALLDDALGETVGRR
jgi:2,2-dialkylglycine decarboxylase (pyruvate)